MSTNTPVGTGNYLVKQGDCIESIAYAHGLFWETVWNDPANAELKEARKDPNVLLPGDRVEVMAKRRKDVSKPHEQRHRFRRKGVPAVFRLQLCDENGPLASAKYVLTIDGKDFPGTTDAEGKLEQGLPPNARSGTIAYSVKNEEGEDVPIETPLSFRHLDPVAFPSGQAARLENLGLYHGPRDNPTAADVAQALSVFQEMHELTLTGRGDEATLAKLVEVHGV